VRVWRAPAARGKLKMMTRGRTPAHSDRLLGVKRATFALAATLIVGLAAAQPGPDYAPADNPFQRDYAFTLGQPVELRVEVEGVRFDHITVTAPDEVRAGESVKCEVQVVGSSVAKKKAKLTPVLLLEDRDGRGLERITLDPFKVKTGRPFDETQKATVSGDALLGASRVYVFVQVEF
jgi:hypothetical protein